MKKIEGNVDISSIKRGYADIKIEAKCPDCDSLLIADLNEDYISYPEVGEFELGFWCGECVENYFIKAKLESVKMVIAYDSESIKKED